MIQFVLNSLVKIVMININMIKLYRQLKKEMMSVKDLITRTKHLVMVILKNRKIYSASFVEVIIIRSTIVLNGKTRDHVIHASVITL